MCLKMTIKFKLESRFYSRSTAFLIFGDFEALWIWPDYLSLKGHQTNYFVQKKVDSSE
jgi:hypothetical protein